jgi:hypothetical protein
MRDLQPFVGTMTLAYRKGAMNEADSLSRRQYFIPQATVHFLGDGEVASNAKLRRKSKPLLDDAQLNSMTGNALRLSPEFVKLIREGYSQDSRFMGTRVSGRKTPGLKPQLETFGVLIAFVFRGTLSADED